MMSSTLFSSLALSADLLRNLETLGYHEMTPIQAKSLPILLKNQDIIAKAKTGSGKTAAFGLGLLSKLNSQRRDTQGLVICPTRELADQVSKEIRRLARMSSNIRVLVLCGGKPFRAQVESLHHGAHIIVGTPGRLLDHIERKTIDLTTIQTLVLDEADRMLDMGFYDNIIDIINNLPKKKQTLLFSATYPSTIKKISQLIQNNPIEITLESIEDAPDINQVFQKIEEHQKIDQLIGLLKNHQVTSSIIFCRTKQKCDEVTNLLNNVGFHALAIHSNLEQKERDEVLLQFANHSCSILVATDVAARGLDIKDLPAVINYDLPSPETYVHRIGRTARAGKSGLAISLFSDRETFKVKGIEEYIKSSVVINEDPIADVVSNSVLIPPMRTLCINGGKKNKIRPGDILGALTGEIGVASEFVGKIDIFDFYSYVAINRNVCDLALKKLQNGKIKGREFKIRCL